MSITYKQANDAGVISVRNKQSNGVERIAFTAGVQIGITSNPADLQLLGSISLSTSKLDLNAGDTKKLDVSKTIFLIKPVGSSGQVNLTLPDPPKNGHRITIKDYSGNASNVSIVVNPSANQTIDGTSNAYTINFSHGVVDLVWNDGNWSVVSNISKTVLMFGCSATNVGLSTDFLNPGGIGAVSTTSPIYLPCPSSGTIRNLSIKQNTAGTTSAGSANLTYTVLVNGVATNVTKDVDVTSTAVATDSTNRATVVVGDQVSVRVSIPANVNLGPVNVVATMEIAS